MQTTPTLPALLPHLAQAAQHTDPLPLPANQQVRTALCTLGYGSPLPVQVAYWIGQPGEVIVEQVRVHGAVLDFAHFSTWALADLTRQIQLQLRRAA